jgi:large subunit ribosomal protein L29
MKVKASELREQSLEELNKRLSDTEEQLFKLRFQKSTGQIEDPTRIREARRNIARVKTVINERRAAPPSVPVEEKSNE